MKNVLLTVLLALFISGTFAQKTNNYKLIVVAFYNLENYYDTIHNPAVKDEDFTPNGAMHYTSKIYWDKTEHLAKVISLIGTDIHPGTVDGPALLGVAEIENDTVLNDLTHNHFISARKYQFVHYDSKDARGIDVALIYNPKYFVVEQSRAIAVKFPGSKKFFTRDILWVKGKLDGETVSVYVNHWPSRLGGEEKSAPFRKLAASICKRHIDSIAFADGVQKVIIMGDFNDDPISPSIIDILGAKEKKETVKKNGIYNPWIELFKKGNGTLAFEDTWSLFDQIMLTAPWLNQQQSGYFYKQQFIFNREFMIEHIGPYKGYPMRTYDGNNYRGGFSDHFPTYVVLLKKLL